MIKYELLNIDVDVSTLSGAGREVVTIATLRNPTMVCVVDVNSLLIAQKSSAHRQALQQASVVTTDGMPIVWLLKLLGCQGVERVSGTELVYEVCKQGSTKGLKHFFLGGPPGLAERVAASLKRAHDIEVVGCFSPPFRQPDEAERSSLLNLIYCSGANVVWVGLGCPKQEKWMLDNYKEIHAATVGVGAAFDFISGDKRRAPKWMQHIGLEWLHRLYSEPVRLSQRYLPAIPQFAFLATKELIIHNFKQRALENRNT